MRGARMPEIDKEEFLRDLADLMFDSSLLMREEYGEPPYYNEYGDFVGDRSRMYKWWVRWRWRLKAFLGLEP